MQCSHKDISNLVRVRYMINIINILILPVCLSSECYCVQQHNELIWESHSWAICVVVLSSGVTVVAKCAVHVKCCIEKLHFGKICGSNSPPNCEVLTTNDHSTKKEYSDFFVWFYLCWRNYANLSMSFMCRVLL